MTVKEAQINSSWRAITWLGRSAALLFLQISRYLLQKAPCNPSQSKRRASTRINLRFLNDGCHEISMRFTDYWSPGNLAQSRNVMTMRTFLVEGNHIIPENLVSTLEELAPVDAIGMADSEEEGATCCRDAISGTSGVMNHTPSVPEPAPGTYIPTEIFPLDAPAGPDQPPEVDQPPPAEPTIPVREPGFHVPARQHHPRI